MRHVLIPIIALVAMSANLAYAADDLASLLWKARPVVVLADAPDDPQFRHQIAMLEDRTALLASYDVKVVRVTHADAALRAKLGAAPTGFAVVLVGKDGDAKRSWRAPVDPGRILALIDAMPMRRDEVKERHGK